MLLGHPQSESNRPTIQRNRGDEHIRWIPASDGLELGVVVLASYHVADPSLLVRLTGFSTVP